MYYYSTWNDIVMTHSKLEEDEMGMPCVRIHFERARESGGFDFADGRIPHYNFQKSFGFSEDELMWLRDYMRDNSFLIWEFAQKGGGMNA